MWLLLARAPTPDANYWRGRRLLATLDAAGWPLMWVVMVNNCPEPIGISGPLVTAVALLSALGRIRRALWFNHRYTFTTWRWARFAALLMLTGGLLKLVMG